jgi:hypothetical protein
MDAMDIVLPTGTFRLPREFILQQMPGSLFANAIELDPQATELPINNPLITPEVMLFLVDYSQGFEPAAHMPELKAVDAYLNVPWMQYYATPNYNVVVDKVHPNADVNRNGIDHIINQDDTVTYAYLLWKGYDPPASDLQTAVYYDSDAIRDLILKSKHFIPEPYRNDLVDALYEVIRGTTESVLGEWPESLRGHVQNNMDEVKAIFELALLLSSGRYQEAYDLIQHSPYTFPEVVESSLRLMFIRPTDNPQYSEDWEEARSIRWVPQLPAEPTDIFG